MTSFVYCCILVSKSVIKEEFEVFVVMVWAVWLGICKINHVESGLGKGPEY